MEQVMDLDLLLAQSIEEESYKVKEEAERALKYLGEETLKEMFTLEGVEFYERLRAKFTLVKIKFGSKDISTEYIEKFEDTIDLKTGNPKFISVCKLVIAKLLNLIQFVGETIVLTGAFASRITFKFASELWTALKNTATFVKEDGKEYKKEVKKSWFKFM